MTWQQQTFFGTVIVGALGLAILLSPLPDLWGLVVIAFAAEAIRAGLVLINVQVRKVNPSQYWIVLMFAITATFGIASAIDAATPRGSLEWWAAQTINFLILAGEYAWAIILAGKPVDWEFEYLNLQGDYKQASAQLEEMKAEVQHQEEQLSAAHQHVKQRTEELELLAEAHEDAKKQIATLAPIAASLRAVEGKKISIDRVGATLCDCGQLIAPPSNSHKPKTCACGKALKWK